MKKLWYNWHDIERMCHSIVNQMYSEGWRPDLIVGITRGGNVPATILSNMLDIPCDTLKVSFRDDDQSESNCWMAEDAFGYGAIEDGSAAPSYYGSVLERRKKILIVDDINDTGRTFKWIMKDWQESCCSSDGSWKDIWGHNVKFAALTENLSSNFELVTYYATEVDKSENNLWVVYPWENVGVYDK